MTSTAIAPVARRFDAIVSSFAIHHFRHQRKRALYAEAFAMLRPGGVFCNLEHVASPTAALHERFLSTLGVPPGEEDPSNKLLALETQLSWLRAIGFEDVDCHWKWRELALMAGGRPRPHHRPGLNRPTGRERMSNALNRRIGPRGHVRR